MRLDRKDGGDYLGGEEEEEGDVKGGAGDEEPAANDHASRPEPGDEDGKGINKKHFGELKKFGGGAGPNERGGEEKQVKEEGGEFGEVFFDTHGCIVALRLRLMLLSGAIVLYDGSMTRCRMSSGFGDVTTLITLGLLGLVIGGMAGLALYFRQGAVAELRSRAHVTEARASTEVPEQLTQAWACRYCERSGTEQANCAARSGACVASLNECSSPFDCGYKPRSSPPDPNDVLLEVFDFCEDAEDVDTFFCDKGESVYCAVQGGAVRVPCPQGCSTITGECIRTELPIDPEDAEYFCGHVPLVRFGGVEVHPDVVGTLRAFIRAAAFKGYAVGILDGYRSCSEQGVLRAECDIKQAVYGEGACVVAPAGYSQHANGHAVDMYLLKNGQWVNVAPVRDLAIRMGMLNPFYPEDPPHFYIP